MTLAKVPMAVSVIALAVLVQILWLCSLIAALLYLVLLALKSTLHFAAASVGLDVGTGTGEL